MNQISNLFVDIDTRLDKLKQGLRNAQNLVKNRMAQISHNLESIGQRIGGTLGGSIGKGIGKGIQFGVSQLAATSLGAIGLGAGFTAAAAGAAALGVSMGVIYKATESSVRAASSLNETVSKTHTLLGTQIGTDVENFAKGLQRAGKVGARQAMEAVSMVSTALTNQGVKLSSAAELGKALTTRAADIASQDNMSVDEVLQKIRSGLAGESEPLRSLGIYISADEAKKSGMQFGEYAANAILKQSLRAEGDQDRTAGSLENLKRSGQIRLEAAMEALGSSFMVFHQAVEYVKGRMIAAFQSIAENPALKQLGEALAQITLNLSNWFSNTFGGAVTTPLNAFVNVLSWAFQQVARVTQLMENYTVAPLSTLRLVLWKLAEVIVDIINYLPQQINKITGMNLVPTLEKDFVRRKQDEARQDIVESGGYRGLEMVRQMQAGNGAPGVREAALRTEQKPGEMKSDRQSFSSLLAQVFGGDEKKYQDQMLQATKQIAENTKPQGTGVKEVAQVGTLRTVNAGGVLMAGGL